MNKNELTFWSTISIIALIIFMENAAYLGLIVFITAIAWLSPEIPTHTALGFGIFMIVVLIALRLAESKEKPKPPIL